MKIRICEEKNDDFNQTEALIEAAFKEAECSDQREHHLVARLRKSQHYIPELSLVAKDGETLVGHLLLTMITIVKDEKQVQSLALAPISVLPMYQLQGIGKKLIEEGLKKARELGFHSVIVLGHPTYYPNFGFKPASSWNITPPFEVPEETFMALELIEDSLKDVEGVVHYAPEFFE